LPTDVKQGALGDCYFLAGLSAISLASPRALQQRIVDFDDGTYGVRLGNSFYRVDNNLPVVSFDSVAPAYAGLGSKNSMWVAIAEKAWAFHRGKGSYGNIVGGHANEAQMAFGSTSAGMIKFKEFANAQAMLKQMESLYYRGEAVTIGFGGGNGGKKKVLPGTTIIADHAYMVMGVYGQRIKLRNPWGVDGGGSADNNPNDGYIFVTAEQLYTLPGTLYWGRVNPVA
jgi:hypothetical protein